MAWRMVARAYGGPDVIEREDFDPGQPGPGEILIEQEAIGLNFIDIYFRTGLYKAPLPLPLGSESAGRVVAVGPDVTRFRVGDKAGCAGGLGAYASHRVVQAGQAVKIPDAISTQDAAAMMLKGMTSCYLAEDIMPLSAGQIALVHAAAGGVGSVLVPWLRDKGVIVIAHSGSPEKAAKVHADHSLHGAFDRLPAAVKEISNGKGADIVFDGVGKDSWDASLACLKRRGMMVSYGNASGAVPPVNLLSLSQGGSLYVTRPTLYDYTATPQELDHCAARLFDRMARAVVKPVIGQRFSLSDAAAAHHALETRQTTGTTILIP